MYRDKNDEDDILDDEDYLEEDEEDLYDDEDEDEDEDDFYEEEEYKDGEEVNDEEEVNNEEEDEEYLEQVENPNKELDDHSNFTEELKTEPFIPEKPQLATVNSDTSSKSESKLPKNIVNQLSNNMAFEVVFELGSINLTINELLHLTEDQMLDVSYDLQQIKIKINGIIIGFGSLVEIDGRYGIKITKLLSSMDNFNSSNSK
jgi:flagellar motor switch/type III secretory pathway protein FliN